MVNSCHFIGNIGQDPQIRFTSGGKAVANFSVAVNERRKGSDGERRQYTTWVRVVAFNKLAEIVRDYMKKGQQVYVEGRYQVREWERNGEKRESHEFVANVIQRTGNKELSNGGEPSEDSSTAGI